MANLNARLVKRYIFDAIMFGYLLLVALVIAIRPADSEMLNLGRNVNIFLGFMLISVALSYFVNANGMKTLGELIFEPAHKKAQETVEQSWYRTVWGWQLTMFFVVTMSLAMHQTKFSIYGLLDEEGFNGAVRLFDHLTSPNMSILPKAVLNIINTIFIAFLATAFAIPIAFLLCFFCAKNIMRHPLAFVIYFIFRTFINVIRSVEALIWAIIFSVWVGIGPFAGMMALLIHSIASLIKQYSEIVETVNEGPIEGIQSTGANKLQTIWYAIVPQVVLPFVSFTVDRWDINVRMATIIGLVGGGGIGTMLINYSGQAMWPEVGCIIIVIAFVVWFMDTASAHIREALK